MWPVSRLGNSFKAHLLVNINPIYHYISIIRQPLLGQPPKVLSWVIVGTITFSGWLLATYIMSRKQQKLIFWLS